jgi:hypothetical protein
MVKYDYLKKYVVEKSPGAEINSFYKVEDEEIKNAEEKLGYKFPEELKEFWREIGSGLFRSSVPEKGITQKDWVNALLYPSEIATILLEGAESELILPEAYERFEGLRSEGDFIFFEIADSSSFLVMNFNKPGVFRFRGNKIADSLEEFVHRLYHESPTYYLNIVD